ncbi:hypothetical protein ACTQ49_06580 [Luteococcus sp. Sow4_B9]|uniref:hypothetical protein n=1 Tax=Luteococcus sp. Sow4_B9 TaxID=3438792 RepID=UPI003F9CA839
MKPMFRTLAAAVLGASLCLTPVVDADAAGHGKGHDKPGHYSFAVIGDVPYGQAQVDAFPQWVDQINASKPAMTFHVGDIKNGSTRCDDDYYAMVRAQFDRFEKPLIYTPGDNEWTDCHRANNGAYNPLERLDHTRETFFPKPGRTLGQKPMTVRSQAHRGVPENVQLRQQGVSFSVIHVVGSNDDLKPWSGIGMTEPTAEQIADQRSRMESAIVQVKQTYREATRRNDRAVVVLLQADMFDPTYAVPWENNSAFQPLVQTLVDESNKFRGESYVIDGDSHVYTVDQPLAEGSHWLDFYGVEGSSELTRITVDGSQNNTNFLRFTVNRPRAEKVLSWEQVPYQTKA